MQHFDYNNWTHDNRQWLRNNLNGQNLLNSIIAVYFDWSQGNHVLFNSKWEIKHGKSWASFKSVDGSLDSNKPEAVNTQIAYRDRYVYEKITNTGIDVTIKWMTKNNINDPNEKPHMATQEWNVPYLDDSFDITSMTIIAAGTCIGPNTYLNSIIGYEYLYNQPSEYHIGIFGTFQARDYPYLSKLDYPNIDVINHP